MHEIKNEHGDIINRSISMRGIREYVGGHLVEFVAIRQVRLTDEEDSGVLLISFRNGAYYECKFSSWKILKETLRNWINLQNIPIDINGLASGYISRTNPELI